MAATKTVTTISEAMRAVSDEYDAECMQGRVNPGFKRLMDARVAVEYKEIDKELPDYIAQIAKVSGVKTGTILPDWIYAAARLCFRLGMRVQRKLDHPGEETTIFWGDGHAG